MKDALLVRGLHVVNAGLQKRQERRILRRQPDLARLAKYGEAVAVASQGFEQGQWICRQFAVRLFPVRKCEGEWKHKRTDEIERERGAGGEVELAARRRAEQFKQMRALIRPKHRAPQGL